MYNANSETERMIKITNKPDICSTSKDHLENYQLVALNMLGDKPYHNHHRLVNDQLSGKHNINHHGYPRERERERGKEVKEVKKKKKINYFIRNVIVNL